MNGLSKILSLYLASLKVTLRSIAILLLSLLVLIVVVLVSLPKDLFTANEVPKISLAIVYGTGEEKDKLIQNIDSGISGNEFIEKLYLSTPEAAELQLASGEIDAMVVVPSETFDTLVYGGHTTITVKSDDPVIGTAIYTVVSNVIETLDELQNYALVFDREAQEHLSSDEERLQAWNDFGMTLIGNALSRMSSVETPWTVSPYFAQVLTLLLFLMVSIGSFFVAVVAARQYASGYVKHLYVRGIHFFHILASQLMLAASIALVLGLILGLIFSIVGSGLSLVALLVSAALLSLVLTALYLMFSGFRQQPKVATTRTLLGCLAAMFFLLFAGGGFYPTAMMQSDMRLFNPTWLSNQLAVWSLGGEINPLQLLPFFVTFVVACAVCYFEWRRVV